MKRKDIYRLAEKLGAISGISADHVYLWLMKLGKAKARNPVYLDIRAVSGMAYLYGDDVAYRLEKFRPLPARHGRIPLNIKVPDYEGMIMERQAWRDIAEEM